MTEDNVRQLLREMRDEPVPPDALARVRRAVDERQTRNFRFAWLIPLLTAAAALAILVVILRPTRSAVQQPVVAKVQPLPMAKPAGATEGIKPVVIKKGKVRRKIAPPRSESIVVRIETPDPDVVILLLGD